MVNFTFIIYHHICHATKVCSARNEIEPEKCFIQFVGKLLTSLTFQLLRCMIVHEVDNLSDHLTVLICSIQLNNTFVSFGFCRN